jgi:Tfp pilus assembly protein PilO
MSRKKSDFKTRLIVQILLIFGILVIFGGTLIFLGRDMKNTAEEIGSTKTDLAIKLAQLGDLARLREDVRIANAKLPILQGALPTKDNLLGLPNRLSNVAVNDGVSINFQFGTEQEGNIDFNLTVEGTYDAMVKFIGDVELTMPFINFSSIDLVQIGMTDTYRSTLGGILFFSE